MKPRKFDDLVRSKFDEGGFDYAPRSWDMLTEQMDKKPGKLKMLVWLPLAAAISIGSVAASLAMIISLPSLWHHNNNARTYARTHAAARHIAATRPEAQAYAAPSTIEEVAAAKPAPAAEPAKKAIAPIIKDNTLAKQPTETLAAATNGNDKTNIDIEKTTKSYPGAFNTRDLYERPERNKNAAKTIVSICGGVNYGSLASGYSLGATGKRMIGEKFYIEGDIAFVSNNATERTEITTTRNSSVAKLVSSTNKTTDVMPVPPVNTIVDKQSNYNLYYAQATPSVGYYIRKGLSVGVGADVQQLLQNNRPTASVDELTPAKEIPALDLGLIGKTECSLSKKVKAGLMYRQGLNNTISSGNKYVDRSYMQVQLKYTIFKK